MSQLIDIATLSTMTEREMLLTLCLSFNEVVERMNKHSVEADNEKMIAQQEKEKSAKADQEAKENIRLRLSRLEQDRGLIAKLIHYALAAGSGAAASFIGRHHG